MFRTLGSNLNGRCAHTRIIQCEQRPLRLFPNVRNIYYSQSLILINQDRRGRDLTVVGFTTTYKISVYHSIQHYAINFISDLRQVGGFLRFPPPIKLTATM